MKKTLLVAVVLMLISVTIAAANGTSNVSGAAFNGTQTETGAAAIETQSTSGSDSRHVTIAAANGISNASENIKTFEQFVGFTPTERIAENHYVVEYLRYLEDVSDLVKLTEIGRTYEYRLQLAAIVTSPANHARLDEIKANAKKLNDPRGALTSEINTILQNQPAIVYLGGSIHGFELSGTEGLLKLLGHLTTQQTPEVQAWLDNTVMIIDPTINADGRDAFAQANHQAIGRVPSADLADWANDFTSWEGLKYRTSHYHFDLNRDWFAHTHPETRNRAALLQEWRPQVGIDAHEMGPNTEFYFDPPTDPRSPHFPEYATKWFELFGKAHADAFDNTNVEYTSKEMFNFFYPSYFTSYMTYQGAVGMLYEQGSSRGLALQRSDGTVRTLNDAGTQQFVAFKAAVKLASNRRADLLRDYTEANRKAIDAGKSGNVRYIIEPVGDPHLVSEAVNMLMRHGIEVHQLNQSASLRGVTNREGVSVGNRSFAPGSYVVEASQPRMAFIRNLLEPSVQIPQDFLDTARKRVDRGENPRFYDITSWSIPLMYNLQGFSSTDNRSLSYDRITEPVMIGPVGPSEIAKYAYIIDGSQARALAAIPYLREEGVRVTVLYKPTQIGGKAYASGSVIVRTDGQNELVFDKVSHIAQRFELMVDALDSGQVDAGFPMLGSVEGTRIQEPKIALLGDHPVQGLSFGFAWHTLDQAYQIPHIVINTRTVGSIPLERFNVIVLPELTNAGLLKTQLGDAGVERLKRWINDGGTLVAIGSGADFVRSTLEMGSLKSWYDDEDNKNSQRVTVPGAFYTGDFDAENWLTSGYVVNPPLLINSNRVLREGDQAPSAGRNVAVRVGSASEGKPISGHVWQENIERTPGSVFLFEEKFGRGRVISFTEDVNFRGYWRGADRLFLNAVILGPSAP